MALRPLQTAWDARHALATYGVFLLLAAIVFSILIALTDNSENSIYHLVLTHIAIAAGTLLGVGLGLLNLRSYLFALLAALLAPTVYFVGESSLPEDVRFPTIIALVAIFPATCVLRYGRELIAAWTPLVYATGAILVWQEDQGLDTNWFRGQKWAIWDVPSMAILAGALLAVLIFFIVRHLLALRLWQPRAPDGQRHPVTLAWRSWTLVLLLAAATTASTALLAPFIWIAVPGDRPSDNEPIPDPTAEPEPGKGEGAGEKLQQLLQQLSGGVDFVMLLLFLLLMLAVLRLVIYPPIRRLTTLRHLEKPAWPVPPTQRIEDLWRRALIALADADLPLSPAEPDETLALRAEHALRARFGQTPPGLHEAAALHTRARFDYALQPDDVTAMAAAVDLTVGFVSDHLDRRTTARNLYRSTDPWSPASPLDALLALLRRANNENHATEP